MIHIEFAGVVFPAWRIVPWQSILKRGMTGLESVVRIREIDKPPFNATRAEWQVFAALPT